MAPETQSMTGRCLCGSVTLTATVKGREHGVCHCSQCRKWSGGPGHAVHFEALEFENDDSVTAYDSSEWAQRGFCNKCGTHLFYRFKENNSFVVWVGAFDDNDSFTLANEIYIDNKPDGYSFAGDHPRLTEQEFLKSMGIDA
ncbi:MAG: GFA family protein [Alphaproteobacteria bacterium]|jgi:hypothetical protein